MKNYEKAKEYSVTRIDDLKRAFSQQELEERELLPAFSGKNVVVSEETLREKTEEIIQLLLRKNTDYGNAWEKHGVAGVLVRISDKALRLKNLEGKEALVVDEGIRDTLRDIAGYALLGLLKKDSEGTIEPDEDDRFWDSYQRNVR